ncbi:MAG: DUF3800 domain-containing protein [Planctomycetota bacterium]
MTEEPASVRNYFVDEAGDPVLFSRRGRALVGTEGCSRFFMLGLLDVPDPDALRRDLAELRAGLLADPYFRGVCSMQPVAGKTAHAFHAKDDLPEVRREVFKLLQRHDVRFFAVVRDKLAVLAYVRQCNDRDSSYRYNPNELYDQLVKRLFRDRLHKDDAYSICFARRGNSDRTEALSRALYAARDRFRQKWGIISSAPVEVVPATPKQHAGLQAADYFLWALQRFYVRREDRYCRLLWPAFSLVHDVDDTREAEYGVYYTKRNPLTLEKLKKSRRYRSE